MSKVVLAMSGGVDSSIAAHLLLDSGHEVVGVFMRHGIETAASCRVRETPVRGKQGCCSASDAADARRVAELLGFPFYALNFDEQFDRIVDYFVDQYLAGRTPNPCIVCNTWLKFGKLLEYADRLGAEYVATGHYARLVDVGQSVPALMRGRDDTKDQAYVLFGIDRSRLARMLMPVGEYHKSQIRAMAERLGLRVADKRDSQEICFVPDQDHARFIHQQRPQANTSGEIVTADGIIVGRHNGIERYTIGQRKGLGVALGDRRFVIRIEPDTRRVVIGGHDDLARHDLVATGANWLIEPPTGSLACQVKIRYRSRPAPAVVEPLAEDRFTVRFDEACYGIAPGQAAVCFDGDRVLGGGWIE